MVYCCHRSVELSRHTFRKLHLSGRGGSDCFVVKVIGEKEEGRGEQ